MRRCKGQHKPTLHSYVQLGCPTLIYRHSPLYCSFLLTNATKYSILVILWWLYACMNKVMSFCDLILTKEAKSSQLVHISVVMFTNEATCYVQEPLKILTTSIPFPSTMVSLRLITWTKVVPIGCDYFRLGHIELINPLLIVMLYNNVNHIEDVPLAGEKMWAMWPGWHTSVMTSILC
jgi:hypothetical protein